MSTPRFAIGDTVWWVYATTRFTGRVPCRMCFGKKRVTLILGDDSTLQSECEACKHGLEDPDGMMEVHVPMAIVKSGIVTGLARDGESWRYEMGHERETEADLYASQDAAQVACVAAREEMIGRCAIWNRDHFITTTKKQIWSAHYHSRRIKDHEQQIEWHRMRLGMIDEKKSRLVRRMEVLS